ncbi:MAG: DUF2282 domain-containing protein [Candidatus Berkiellales bacterium]
MKDLNSIIHAAIKTALTISLVNLSHAAIAHEKHGMEKCYGIAKAGKNDCTSDLRSCAGTAKEDRQANAFINIPKGVCRKITRGQLKPPKSHAQKINKKTK